MCSRTASFIPELFFSQETTPRIKHFHLKNVKQAWPSRSKALHSGCSLSGGLGSNPSACMFLTSNSLLPFFLFSNCAFVFAFCFCEFFLLIDWLFLLFSFYESTMNHMWDIFFLNRNCLLKVSNWFIILSFFVEELWGSLPHIFCLSGSSFPQAQFLDSTALRLVLSRCSFHRLPNGLFLWFQFNTVWSSLINLRRLLVIQSSSERDTKYHWHFFKDPSVAFGLGLTAQCFVW